MKMRETKQKETVLQCVCSLGGHPSADEVYASVTEMAPKISRATVYRNLQALASQQKLRAVELPQQPTRYELFTKVHYHFYCRGCGCILDIKDEVMPLFPEFLNKDVSARTGLQVERHRLSFGGLCLACMQRDEE